jgi:DNA-binding transcriptional ArsR family regulator
MDELLAGLKAIAETTRIRILFVLSHGELNVSELTYILGQSQPRVSRHLKLMAEAGLLSRNKEGQLGICSACAAKASGRRPGPFPCRHAARQGRSAER